MRRIALGIAILAVAGTAGAYALTRLRPQWMPVWAERLLAERSVIADDNPEPVVTTLVPAPADGWCTRPGASPAADCPPSLDSVVLTSPDIAARIGLETEKTQTVKVAPKVYGNAEISYASHDMAEVRPRVAGRIAKVYRDEGDLVRKGDLLVEVDSAEVGSAKANYLSLLPIVELARQDATRTSNLRRSGAVSEKEELTKKADLNRAEAELMNARQRLLNLGLTEADLAEIARTKDTSSLLKIYAPQAGTLVERHAVQGEAVEANTQIFIDADLTHVWCWIDIYENDVVKVQKGQNVSFTIAGTEGPQFTGTVELIGFSVSPVTRTIRVRAELHNVDGRLLSNQYGRASIQVGREETRVIVSRDAVQSENGQEFVFQPQQDGKTFRTQRVSTSPIEVKDHVEVTFGLSEGETVVTTGSFLLKTELFKSNLASEE